MESVPVDSDRRDSATSQTDRQVSSETIIESYGESNESHSRDAAAAVTSTRTSSALDQLSERRAVLEEERLRRFTHHSQSGLPAAIVFLVQPMLLFSCWFWISMINDSDMFTPTPAGTCFFFFGKIKSGFQPMSGFMAFLSVSLAITPYLSLPAYFFNSHGHPRFALVLSLFTIPYWIYVIIDVTAKLLLPIFCGNNAPFSGYSPSQLEVLLQ